MRRGKRTPAEEQMGLFYESEILHCHNCRRNYIVMPTRMWRFVPSRLKVLDIFMVAI